MEEIYCEVSSGLDGRIKYSGAELFMDYAETGYGKVEFGIYGPDRNMIIVSSLAQ